MDANIECLHVLFLEDSQTDIELIFQKLSMDFNCPVDMDAATGEAEFHKCLEDRRYDLILADYTLPGYCATAALEHVKATCPDVPFICISGTIGEEAAVELLKQGATDYVLKDRLGRLSFAVLRALENAGAEAENRRADEERRRHETFERAIRKLSQDFINMPMDRLDDAIVNAMGMIAGYCQADRVSVYRFDWRSNTAGHYLEWTREPGYRTHSPYLHFPLSMLGGIMDNLSKGRECVQCSTADMPERAVCGPVATDMNVKSKCTFPMSAEGNLIGMVAAYAMEQEKIFSNDEVTAMRLFAEMLASVLMRKDSEDALRQLVEDHRLMLDATTDGVAMLDYDGIVLSINRVLALRNGKLANQLIGHSFKEILPHEKCAELYQTRLRCIRSVFETGESIANEDASGGCRFNNRYFPIIKDDRIAAVALFSTDITSRCKAEEETRKRLETEARLNVMTEFFTNVSHELKTPLSLILMQLDMMRMHAGNADKTDELMADATLNAYRLTRLVSNLLDITKMDAGFLKLNLRNRDIVSILTHIADSVKDYAVARKIDLRFVSNVQVKRMDVDSDKIERAVLNLLSNAIKHTPEGGQIELELTDGRDSVAIRVTDTGEGIPEDKLGIVFDRFAQVNNRMNRQTEGCGIGLALVKSMTELHGGRVWAQSEPGRGSVFTMELPVRNTARQDKPVVVEGFELSKKVKMELSDLYIKMNA